MNVSLLAHTRLPNKLILDLANKFGDAPKATKAVSLTAIRTCYSHLKPKDILFCRRG